MQSVFSAKSGNAQDLNEIARVWMQQMEVRPQLLHDVLGYRPRAPDRSPQLIFVKDQLTQWRFRPIMQSHVSEHSIVYTGQLSPPIGSKRMLLSLLINPVRKM